MGNPIPEKTIRRSTLVISIGLFAVALTQKCFNTNSGWNDSYQGAYLLISGFFGFLGGESAAWLCWLANPALFIAWIKFNRKRRTSLISSIIAIFFCLMFLSVSQIMIDESGSNFAQITGHEIGYWLWLSSACVMLIGNIIIYLNNKATERYQS